MKVKEKQVESRWVTVTAKWNKAINKFTNHSRKESFRTIRMRILERRDGRDIIQFIGGPTGHESYYINDLLVAVGRKP